MKLTDVIRRPLVTEKTTVAREQALVVVFEVAPQATKVEIKHAVEKLLGSKVAKVRTQLMHGKFKRQGRFEGQRSGLEEGMGPAQGRRKSARVHGRGLRPRV